MTIMYHDGNRRLQDQFDSRRISDRLEEKLTRTAFTPDDKAFLESAIYFFMATADAEGSTASVSRNDCSTPAASAAVTVTVRPSARAAAGRLSSPVSGSTPTPSPDTLNLSTEPWKKEDRFKASLLDLHHPARTGRRAQAQGPAGSPVERGTSARVVQG